MKIAFYGSRGAYTEAAAAAIFDEDIATYPYPYLSFKEMFDALDHDKVDLVMVPYHSSRVGVVPEILHFMREREVYANYQVKIHAAFALAGAMNASESDVRTIHADPMAMVYCSQYLGGLKGITFVPTFGKNYYEDFAKKQDASAATLCSKFAASVFGMKVLRVNCNDDPMAWMTYMGFAKEPRVPDAKELKKGKPVTMLVLDLADEPGALMHALEAFATEDINLISMELRPTDRSKGRVSFFMTFEGVYTDDNVSGVLRKLESVTAYVRNLGSYVHQTID